MKIVDAGEHGSLRRRWSGHNEPIMIGPIAMTHRQDAAPTVEFVGPVHTLTRVRVKQYQQFVSPVLEDSDEVGAGRGGVPDHHVAYVRRRPIAGVRDINVCVITQAAS